MAQSVVLTWNPSTDSDVVGYKVYSGTVSQNYTNIVVVGNATNVTISGLAYGTTYYFAATTYDDSGNESPYSNEAIFSVPKPTSFSSTALSLPTLNVISSVVVTENAAVQSINLSGITMSGSAVNVITPQTVNGRGSPTLQITATSSNPEIIPTPSISYISPKSTGVLSFQPVANANGRAIITVTLNNGQQSNNITIRRFAIAVLPIGSGPPQIMMQPTNVAAIAGNTISFNVGVVGQGPLEYQWLLNGAQIFGATGPTLSLTNITALQAGNYYVTISNDLGLVSSGIAVLSVYSTSEARSSAVVIANAAATARAAENASHQIGIGSPPAVATLTSPVKMGGQFSLVVSGIDGSNYVVQASSDMENWVSLQTNASPFTFVDTTITGSSQRFYRAYQLP